MAHFWRLRLGSFPQIFATMAAMSKRVVLMSAIHKMSASSRPADWNLIAEGASRETDRKKLQQLVRALCDLLQELQASRVAPGPADRGSIDS
jgi:hypothetical protein